MCVGTKKQQAPFLYDFVRSLYCALLLLLWFAAGCVTPIGVTRASTQDTYYALTANVLSAGEPSSWSNQVLHRSNLKEKYDDDPEAALTEMRKALVVSLTPDRLFALSELSFYYAEHSQKNAYYLASAVYAYAFLFPEEKTMPLDRLDPRRRLAADLYNLGLVRGLDTPDGEAVILQEGTLKLPFGEIELSVDQASYIWGAFRFKRFIPVGDFQIRGLSNRYRQAGIGAPLAAELEPLGVGPEAEEARKRIPARIKVPVTAFIRFADPVRAVVEGKIQGRIELYAADLATTVRVDDRDVPLELEPTAVLAYGLEGAPVWDFEIAGFRVADPKDIVGDGLIMLHPYRPGRIPVILIHGTASSPARWAEMYNELMHEPTIEGRYQFWLFQYNTGQPILYSAMLLRRALKNIVKELDPKGEDLVLQRMVLIGHSQGGLLAKLMVVKSGNRFWQNASSLPFDEVEMPSETRDLLREAEFFEPVSTVKRVIFIATPHRGSYQATGWALNLLRRLIRLPGNLVSQFQDVLTKGQAFAHLGLTQIPTSVDNMSPNHPFLKALNDLPIDPSIPAHSIIAVLGEGPVTGKTDGVVAYESAHIEGVESEKVVRSPHSTQANPETIEEVRRILSGHLKQQ
jgi:pimeloyl-ACP methyl ester carboxylesterase